MEIAILTHPLGTNYGGILQNFALQKVLKSLGHSPETLDYYTETPVSIKVMSLGKRLLNRVKGQSVPIRGWANKKEQQIISQNTRQFIKDNICTTGRFLLSDLGKQRFSNYDAIIVGSDQVWRGNNPDVKHFFLYDVQDYSLKRVAYAASFGTEHWEYSEKASILCSKLLSKFNSVSVRENTGVAFCRKYFKREVELVLDPTLLLNAEDYSKLISDRQLPSIGSNKMMVYILDKTKEKSSIVKNVSSRLNLEPFTVMAERYFSETGSKGIEECIYPPVEMWLQGFRDASYVVTDSFHGTVFSILNHKNFISIVNKERGADRFKSILGLLGLENRLVEREDQINSVLSAEIDYAIVDQKLHKIRNASINFLINSLK